MATDWAADVKKYDANADDAAIAGIVRHCGIALRNRDSALVSFSDKAETDRVRTNFLKKKLGLTQADSVLNAAIAKVGAQMKADRTKNRVTVYYLLASEFKQLGLFIKAAPAAKKARAAKAAPAAAVPAKPAAANTKTAAKAAGAAAVVAGAAAAAKAKPAKAAPAKAAPVKKAGATKAAAAPAKKVTAAPAKKAAAPAKATTAKAVASVSNATQGLLDKAASTASGAGQATTAAVAGTVAAAGALGAAALGAAAGAADTVKDGAAKAAGTAASAVGGVADKAGSLMAGGVKAATGAAAATTSDDDGSEMNWLWWVIGLAVLAFLAWWWVTSRNPDIEETNATEVAASAAASDVGTDLAAAAPENSVTIPTGAGVTSEMRDGKPVVKVYFDSGMTAVTPDFTKTAGGLKSWLDTHSGSTLAVSGYSDPSGNAAANAELAKQRAQAVQSALVAADIPATSAALVKPAQVSDATVAKEAARRVEVVVK